ncbi:hypothetical protein AB4P95_09970 [Pseudomonas sp. A1437]|uniref:hypothetical protein n=1 Tax=unclassified Pseudomonas TaxID=196821 RepID=UPI0037852949
MKGVVTFATVSLDTLKLSLMPENFVPSAADHTHLLGRPVAASPKYSRFFEKQVSNRDSTPASQSPPKATWLAKAMTYSGLMANASQVLMLAVVVVGYVYTVRPVFQKEVVSEDLARLQLEQRKLQHQMEGQAESLLAGEAKNKDLADQRASIEKQIVTLNQKVGDAEKSARDAMLRAQRATAEAKTAESTLAGLQAQHYGLKVQSLLGQTALPSSMIHVLNRSTSTLPFVVFKDEKAGSIAQKLQSLELQPLDLAKSTLSQLQEQASKQSRAPSAAIDALLVRNYEKGMFEHTQDLTCPTPAYADWQSAFQSAVQASEGNIRDCVRESWADRVEREGWSPFDIRNLQKTDSWKQLESSFNASCKLSYSYLMRTAFEDAWKKADEACDERRMYVNQLVMGTPFKLRLTEFTVVTPPSTEEIAKLFRNRNAKEPAAQL